MIELISNRLLALIGVAFISAAAEPFVKRTPHKQVLRLVVVVCMGTMLLAAFLKMSYFDYASALRSAEIHDIWDADRAEISDRELKRKLIESECCAYIEDEAARLGLQVQSVEVILKWNTNGYWVPERTVISVDSDLEEYDALRDVIATDLGVCPQMQEWRQVSCE